MAVWELQRLRGDERSNFDKEEYTIDSVAIGL